MTRIGFAYNQKPEQDAPLLDKATAHSGSVEDGELDRLDEEPPSKIDEYAEWDSIATIDAVANALSPLGGGRSLEKEENFPELLRETNPDIVFNIAEGKNGVNREAHVPAICEFYGIPYSGSDPLTLSLCLDKARAKETLAFHGVPTAPFAVATSTDDLRAI